jgi:hypothetical protein
VTGTTASVRGPLRSLRSQRRRQVFAGVWRQELRLQPWTFIGATVALGAAWAAESHLDVSIERSLLVLVTTVALAVALVDAASPLTAASPTPLVLRRATRAVIPLGILAGSWIMMLVVVSSLTPEPVEPTPWWAAALEWATVAGTQLAVAASPRASDGSTRSVAPGAMLALAWFAAIQAAPTHARLYPVADHTSVWVTILCVAVLGFAVCSTDPARRTRRWPVTRGRPAPV